VRDFYGAEDFENLFGSQRGLWVTLVLALSGVSVSRIGCIFAVWFVFDRFLLQVHSKCRINGVTLEKAQQNGFFTLVRPHEHRLHLFGNLSSLYGHADSGRWKSRDS
jgi:hypothetical protein